VNELKEGKSLPTQKPHQQQHHQCQSLAGLGMIYCRLLTNLNTAETITKRFLLKQNTDNTIT